MKVKYENFVGVYENAVSDKFCDNLIEYYEYCKSNNRTFGRPDSERFKNDSSAVLNAVCPEDMDFLYTQLNGYIGEFNYMFWDVCYPDYVKKYSVLEDHEKHSIFTYKVQKTLPGGGYHIWHCEDGAKENCRRIMTYVLYLNDIEEGGETEFLYYGMRVKPKKGTLVLFPPNYPWAHRGNPPLSGEKYIMTGWTEFS